MKEIYIGAGCFWGVQSYFKKIKGVNNVYAGYANGPSDHASYEDVCKGLGHAEVVKFEYDQTIITEQEIFNLFLRIINPFSLNKQGNDVGIQYRTCIYSDDEANIDAFKTILKQWEQTNGKSAIEIKKLENFVLAEEYHQEYLHKNPNGYCHINLNDIPDEYKK